MKITRMNKLKTTITSLALVFATIASYAQDDKAKSILDKLSKKTESYTSMQADFEYTMFNQAESIDDSQLGSLKTQGEKYNVNIAGQNIISDGKTVWTVLEDAEEVQINEVPEEGESEDYINPVNILTLWEKGFKYKYDSKTTLNDISVDVINLFPDNADEQSYHTIKLYVNQEKMIVEKIEIKGKDGTDFIYNIKSFKSNEAISPSIFTFDSVKNSDFEVIDLR
jgi:outer membrane lipoprotein-sorting protein